MKKLSHAQVAMLKSIRDHADPFHHLQGRSARGGGSGTLASLYKRHLIDRHHPEWMLSAAGENALKSAETTHDQ